MTKKIDMEKLLREFPTFEQHIMEELQDEEYQREYLRIHVEEFAKDGDYAIFFKGLERVIKARTSVSKFARDIKINRSNLTNILKGKVKPSFYTVVKILEGLDAKIDVKFG